jgi:hypothetical protein
MKQYVFGTVSIVMSVIAIVVSVNSSRSEDNQDPVQELREELIRRDEANASRMEVQNKAISKLLKDVQRIREKVGLQSQE